MHRGRDAAVLYGAFAVAMVAFTGWLVWNSWPERAAVPVPDDLSRVDPVLAREITKWVGRVEVTQEAEDFGRLGAVYEAHDFLELAVQCYERAAELDGSNAKWRYRRAVLAEAIGQRAEAEQGLREAISLRPDYAPAYERLGLILLDRNDLEGARGAFRQVIRLAPKQPQGYVRSAAVELAAGRGDEALEHLDRAVAIAPKLSEAHYLRGMALRELGREKEAAVELARGGDARRVLLPDPWRAGVAEAGVTASARMELATSLIVSGRPADAIPILEELIREDRTDVHALNQLGVAYMQVGRSRDAVGVLRRASKVRPEYATTLINLAKALRIEGDWKRALGFAERAVELAPQSSDAHATVGSILGRMQDFAGALGSFRRAAALAPNDARLQVAVGEMLALLERWAEAAGAFERAVRLRPDSEDYRAKLELARARAGKPREDVERPVPVPKISPSARGGEMAVSGPSTVERSGSGGGADVAAPWFEEVAETVRIDFRHVSGRAERPYMPEIMAGGVCLLDYDRDGFLDAYFVQAGRVAGPRDAVAGNQLYRNRGDGTFEETTDRAGVGDRGYGMGCTVGDFDDDGWVDLYVTNVGPNVLYRNEGNGSFADVTERAGVGDPGFSASAVFFDCENDGDPDLFVANYIRWSAERELECRAPAGQLDYCQPTNYEAPAGDTLFRNNGDGTFDDATAESGLSVMYGYGLGVVAADFDGDGLTDLGVANDQTANQLWMNRGEGRFVDEALVRGVAYNGEGAAEAGMGVDARDVDGDGDLDLFMTHFAGETHTLYVNESGFWEDRTNALGLGSSRPFTGFGTALADLNNDGLPDIYVASGRVVMGHGSYPSGDPYAEPDQLFRGLADGSFAEVEPRGGTAASLVHTGRGAAFGDYDNDGDVDIFVVNRDGPAYVMRNVAGSNGRWMVFEVLNTKGAPDVGARVEIEVSGVTRVGDVRPGYGYCSANDSRVHFGLGTAVRVDRARVFWADGTAESLGPLAADQIVTVQRGE